MSLMNKDVADPVLRARDNKSRRAVMRLLSSLSHQTSPSLSSGRPIRAVIMGRHFKSHRTGVLELRTGVHRQRGAFTLPRQRRGLTLEVQGWADSMGEK